LLGWYERVCLLLGPSFATRAYRFEQPGIHTLYGTQPLLPPKTHGLFAEASLILWYGEDQQGRLSQNLRQLCNGQVVIHSPRPVGVKHVTDHLLKALDRLGIPRPDSVPPLEVPASLPSDLQDLLSARRQAGKTVVVHPGASGPEKRVGPEVWADVLRGLSRGRDIRAVVLSGPEEDHLAFALCAEVRHLEPLLVHNRPLRDVAALLKSAALFMGNDSGITHLAAAVGSPTVAVFRATDPRVWAPQGEHVRIVQVDDKPGTAHLILSGVHL
jgi:ADP-heptose:LPS heptosyltransferase